MKSLLKISLLMLVLAGICGHTQSQPYQPTWESLSAYRCPDWFRDAKFGIFIHWGLYAVPVRK
jgi:alpha-L-fucosidase